MKGKKNSDGRPAGRTDREPQARNGLAVDLARRNPLHDWDHVASQKAASGCNDPRPFVTVIVTVYKRLDFLFESIRSVLDQDFVGALEIIIVDDDPSSDKNEALFARFPQLAGLNVTYYVNEQNLGLFGNWNRGLTLARGEWVTILNDDDLLDPACLSTLFAAVADDPTVDAIIPAKRILDQRLTSEDESSSRNIGARRTLPQKLWWVLSSRKGRRTLASNLFNKALQARLYRGSTTRRLRPHNFFWGNVIGNPVGFVFKRDVAMSLGGFYADEFPSSDHLFFARVADGFHFRQHRAVNASFRLAENESLKPETVLAGMQQSLLLQRIMAGRQVPHWWLRLSPLVMAYHHGDGRRFLGVDLPKFEVTKALQLELPRERPVVLASIRLLLGGY